MNMLKIQSIDLEYSDEMRAVICCVSLINVLHTRVSYENTLFMHA